MGYADGEGSDVRRVEEGKDEMGALRGERPAVDCCCG